MIDLPFSLRFVMVSLAVYRLARMIALEEGPFEMFTRLRTWAGSYDFDETGQVTTLFGRLMACPLCIGIWLSFLGLIPLYSPGVNMVLVSWLAIAGLQTVLYRFSQ